MGQHEQKRRYLTAALIILILLGLGAIASAFTKALGLTAVSALNAPHINIANLQPGQFLITATDENSRALVIRDYDGKLYVLSPGWIHDHFWLPFPSGYVELSNCKDFSPDQQNGRLLRGGTLHCQDQLYPPNNMPRMHWTYAGNNIEKEVDGLWHWQYAIDAMPFS